MATFETTQPQPIVLFTLSQVKDVVTDVMAKFETAKKARKDKAELQGLSDRELNEIGISRADINGLF